MSKRIFAIFRGEGGEPSLAEVCGELLRQQKAEWPEFLAGHQALENAAVRDIACSDFTIKAQWNPRRIASTGARLDPRAIRERPCFLCRNNLPEQQRAILYRESYLILCNPAPIFPRHYTIAHIHHRDQSIVAALGEFLLLIRDFAPKCLVFYNGPQSGASAPDHLHFQAAPAGLLPVEGDLHMDGRLRKLKQMKEVEVFMAENLGRPMLLLMGEHRERVAAALSEVISVMESVGHQEGEPMMNLLGWYRNDRWNIMVFPRRRNRPSVYDLPDDERVLISPGGVEMGGLFITPVEKDFRILDDTLVRKIYGDVSVDDRIFRQIIDRF